MSSQNRHHQGSGINWSPKPNCCFQPVFLRIPKCPRGWVQGPGARPASRALSNIYWKYISVGNPSDVLGIYPKHIIIAQRYKKILAVTSCSPADEIDNDNIHVTWGMVCPQNPALAFPNWQSYTPPAPVTSMRTTRSNTLWECHPSGIGGPQNGSLSKLYEGLGLGEPNRDAETPRAGTTGELLNPEA